MYSNHCPGRALRVGSARTPVLYVHTTCSLTLEPLPHCRRFQCCLIIWMLKTTRIPGLAKGDCSSTRHPQRYPATQSVWRSMRWHLSACERSSESTLGELSQRCFSLMYNQLRHGIPSLLLSPLNRLLIADTPRPVTLTIAFVHLRTFICRCRVGPPATATPIVARFCSREPSHNGDVPFSQCCIGTRLPPCLCVGQISESLSQYNHANIINCRSPPSNPPQITTSRPPPDVVAAETLPIAWFHSSTQCQCSVNTSPPSPPYCTNPNHHVQ